MENYADTSRYEVTLVFKRSTKNNRLKHDLEFSFLPFTIIFLELDLDLKKKLSKPEKESLDHLLALHFETFGFFQEQDPIAIIIINHYKTRNTKIHLFQDGLKPYIAHSMSFSPALIINNVKQNIWIKKNGYPITNYFSFINCKMYGFLKGIDKLFLTFPEAYINWNKLAIDKIEPTLGDEFVTVLKKLFLWNDGLLQKRENVIFFMNQPMHDDGSFEVNLLQNLQKKYPDATIYIKNHPLTSKVKIEAYKQISNVTLISSKIPAELFISQLSNSIILSVCSTSMFIDNPKCKFYYTFAIEENNNIERLKKYKVINPTKHVISVHTMDDILF
jgi:hypothetical protein